jgi:hypothetical protein
LGRFSFDFVRSDGVRAAVWEDFHLILAAPVFTFRRSSQQECCIHAARLPIEGTK